MMQIPRIKFKIATLNEEAERIYEFRNKFKLDNSQVKNFIFIDLSNDLIKEILNFDFYSIKEKMIKEIERENEKHSEINLKDIEDYWHKINESYFNELINITDAEFEFNEYIVVLSNSVCGHYLEGKNIVYSNVKYGIKACCAMIAEELLHLHYWSIIKRYFKKNRNNLTKKYGNFPWKISEIIPEYILIKNPIFEQFNWNKWNRKQSYPWIDEIKPISDKIWLNKKNFKDFLINIHKKFNCQLEF